MDRNGAKAVLRLAFEAVMDTGMVAGACIAAVVSIRALSHREAVDGLEAIAYGWTVGVAVWVIMTITRRWVELWLKVRDMRRTGQ